MSIKIFQISSEVNSGSVGRIAEQIGEEVIKEGWKSYIAYARDNQISTSETIKIGNNFSIIKHGILTRLTDRHGFGSEKVTLELIRKIEDIDPDIVQLQHMHGYFINIQVLFNYLSKKNIPVVWTFHDCWSFTGHCAHFEYIGCEKWLTHCEKCPQTNEYPKSFVDQSYKNFEDKRRLFNSVSNITIVPVSKWLGRLVEKSFFQNSRIKVIHNGIDLEKFTVKPNNTIKKSLNIEDKFLILGVASPWTEKKGFHYFIELSKKISSSYQIILIGLSKDQIKNLPVNIYGIERTENVEKLAEFYSAADVFVNLTLEDTFPTTNLEALACGTPVVTFNTGGSPEGIDTSTGIIIEKENTLQLIEAIEAIKENTKEKYSKNCRARAEQYFDKSKCFTQYIEIYKEILNKN